MIKEFIAKLKNKMAEKKEQHRQRLLARESIVCPYCQVSHVPDEYVKTAKEDIVSKTRHSRIEINFMKCKACGKLMGVKSTSYYEPGVSFYRSAFSLEDKETEE